MNTTIKKSRKWFFERLKNSNRLKTYLTLKARAVHKDFGIADAKIRLVSKPAGMIACTNNEEYVLNTGHKQFYEGLDEEETFIRLLGVLLHEIGHRLFTPFTAFKLWAGALRSGTFYPAEPVLLGSMNKSYQEVKMFISKKEQAQLLISNVGQLLFNVLEDAREEELCLDYCSRHRTLYQGLLFDRELSSERDLPFSVANLMYEEGTPQNKISALMSLILHYAKFTDIKDDEEADITVTNLYQTISGIIPYIDTYLTARTAVDMFSALNLVLLSIWPEIKEFFEAMKNPKDLSDESEKAESSGSSPEYSEDEITEEEAPEDISLSEEEIEACTKALSAVMDNLIDHPEDLEDLTGSGTDSDSMDALLGDMDCESVPEGSEELSEGKFRAKKDLDSLLSEIKRDKEEEEAEKKLKETLKDIGKDVNIADIHKGVNIVIKRPDYDESNQAVYNDIASPLKKVAAIMARKSVFFDETGEQILTNRYYGSKLNAPSFARNDFKFFKKLVEGEPGYDIAVSVLVDESGSMSCDRRYIAARDTAIVLYEYCNLLNIPIAIYGHSTTYECSREDLLMIPYADYDRECDKDKYRLAQISAKSNNRDGFALEFMRCRLARRSEHTKLLFIISDGEPYANGYYGAEANADLHNVAQQCEKDNIILIAAAIGSDKEEIKQIYGETHFLDISDLNAMPTKLVSLIKRRIRK